MNDRKFITETGPNAPWVIIYGPTAVGKSHFIETHRLYEFRRNWKPIWTSTGCSQSRFLDLDLVPTNGKVGIGIAGNHFKLSRDKFNLGGVHIALTSDPKQWPSGWFTKDYKIKKTVIILGVPYSIWRERLKLRGKDHEGEGAYKKTPAGFKKIYTRAITRIEQWQQMEDIPYIFVDNRNDYPILDKDSFLEML